MGAARCKDDCPSDNTAALCVTVDSLENEFHLHLLSEATSAAICTHTRCDCCQLVCTRRVFFASESNQKRIRNAD